MMLPLTPAHLDHRRIWRDFEYCYPVISRRARGLSLGVNLNLSQACNFNCVYCEVDRLRPSRRKNVDLDQLEAEMKALMELAVSNEIFGIHPFSSANAEHKRLNDIAFSGDGEPTAAREFPECVRRLARLKDSFGLPGVKMVLITNSTMLQDPKVVAGIDELMANNGEIWAKLDGGTEGICQAINRSEATLDGILANLEFAGKRWPITIQTLLLEWEGKGPAGPELDAYIAKLKQLARAGVQIQRLQLLTIARPTPEPAARSLRPVAMDKIASQVSGELPGLPVEVFYGPLA